MGKISSVSFLCSLGLVQAQENNSVLLTIDGREITSDEFLRIYNKNNNIGANIETKTIDEYLELPNRIFTE